MFVCLLKENAVLLKLLPNNYDRLVKSHMRTGLRFLGNRFLNY